MLLRSNGRRAGGGSTMILRGRGHEPSVSSGNALHGRDLEMREINADRQKENRRMRRLTGQSRHVRMAVLIALVGVLALGGCSKKNVMATTEGTGNAQAGGGAPAEGGPGGSGGSMGEGGG